MRKFRYLFFFLLFAVAAVVAISFHQPPMRLMPAPAVFLDGDINAFSGQEQPTDSRIQLFYATNRLPIGPRAARIYTVVPGRDLHVGTSTVRVGDEATTWERLYEWSTRAGNDNRPFLYLETMAEQASIDRPDALSADAKVWFDQINEALAASRDRDIIVYVHGANTTVERAAGQAAQLRHFTGRNSVVVLFVWPTAENFLRYSRDMLTAFGAAPHLADLVRLLERNTNAENIDVFTYSAGATVGSDALALLGRDAAQDAAQPGAGPHRLGEIYHAAPDADFRGFVDDMKSYAEQAKRVTVSVNLNDSALRLSQAVNRASRAGRPDMAELSPQASQWMLDATKLYGLELLQVRPENIPGLSRRSHTFWYDDPWVSSDVLLTLLFHLPPAERGLDEGKAPSGAPYWTFTPDYPERLAEVMARLRRNGQAAATAAP